MEYQNDQVQNLDDDQLFDSTGYDELDPESVVTWKASEYIHHQKSPVWFVVFGVIAFLLAVGFFLILRDFSILVLIVVMSVALFTYASRKPQTLEYNVSNLGVMIGERGFGYDEFRSFCIMQFDGIPSIELDPVQRFRPAVSLYFDPKDGDKIIKTIATYLPLDEREPDIIDKLIRVARF